MFPSLELATLANKVARNILEVTRSSILSPEESMQNVKTAKEAVSKAMCEIDSTAQAPKPQPKKKTVNKSISSKEATSKDTVGVRQIQSGNWVRR